MPSQADIALQALGALPSETAASGSQADRALASIAAASPPLGPRGFGGQLGDFSSALLHHLGNLPHGAAQLVENAASGAVNSIAPSSAAARWITPIVDADNAAMAQREAEYQKRTPNSAGAYAGATAGEVLPFLAGGAGGLQKVGDYAAGLLPKATPAFLQRTASGVTQGAAVGAAQPVNDPGYWQQKAKDVAGGAAVMGAIPAVGALAGAVKNAALPIVSPKSVVAPLVQKLTGADPAMIEALRNPQQIVPGSVPTTAQILATPQAVATEKALANSSPAFKNTLTERANANNAARLSAIEGVAKSPDDIANAIKARSDAVSDWTGPQGKLAAGSPVDVTSILRQLDDLAASPLGIRPTIGGAARDIADTLRGHASVEPGTRAIPDGMSAAGLPIPGSPGVPSGPPLVSPADLDAVRQNVKDFLAKHAPNGAVGSQQQAAFDPVRSAIVDSIESANPGYRDYLATYAKASQPINTMEAAGGILDNVGGDSRAANSAGAPQVTLSRYSSALARALKSPFGIDPEAQATLQGVQSDLQRESISNSIKAPGSDTAYNLQAPGWLASQMYGDNFSGSTSAAKLAGALMGGAGGYLTGSGGYGMATGAAVGMGAMNKVAQFGQGRVNDLLSRALTDPEFAAQLAAQAQSKKPGLLSAIPQSNLLGP